MIGIVTTSVPSERLFSVAMAQFIVSNLRPISVIDGVGFLRQLMEVAEPRSLSSSMSKDNVWDN